MISPQSLIVILLMILTPFILYAFFFLIKCSPSPFHHSGARKPDTETEDEKSSNMEMIKAVGKDTECPVCLSVFKEGEELKMIKNCKHFFHESCIDTWLSCNFNCPVCRAFVSKRVSKVKGRDDDHRRAPVVLGRDDQWQGLPDSSGLV